MGREQTRVHQSRPSPRMGRWGSGDVVRGSQHPQGRVRSGGGEASLPPGHGAEGGAGHLVVLPRPEAPGLHPGARPPPDSLLPRDEHRASPRPCWRKPGPWGPDWMEDIRVPSMAGSVFTAEATPPAIQSPGHLTVPPSPPQGPPASSSTSQQRAQHGAMETGGERRRGGEKGTGEGKREAPSVQRGFSADPERPLPPPPPSWHSWAQEGEGGRRGVERGAVGPHTWLPTLHGHPSLPGAGVGGSTGRITDTTPPQEEEPRGGRMSGDPPGSGDARQAGHGRAAAGVGDCCGQPDTTSWMLVPPSLCPSRAAPLWAVLRPGGRC